MLPVHERRVFSAADLRRMLMRVLCAHAGADVTIYIDFKAVEQLEQDLRVFAIVDHLDALAQLMASMATMVSHPVRVVGYTGEDSPHKGVLTRKLHTEFSIECVVSFARRCGYRVSIDQLTHDQISLALLMSDWARLVELFEQSACRAAIGEGMSDLLYEDEDDSYGQIQQFERQFDRQLSSESYWNLRSAADDQRWRPSEVLMLVEEHLRPELDASLVHHSETVSSEEWVNRYDWLRREDGHTL